MKIKLIALSLSSLFLVACGGGSDSDSGNVANIAEPTLSELSGVWDFTEELYEDDEVMSFDNWYILLNDSGEFKSYIYIDMEEMTACYAHDPEENGAITDLGEGHFEIVDAEGESTEVDFSITDYRLRLYGNEGDGFEYLDAQSTSLKESDFTPLCSEVNTFSSNDIEAYSTQRNTTWLNSF